MYCTEFAVHYVDSQLQVCRSTEGGRRRALSPGGATAAVFSALKACTELVQHTAQSPPPLPFDPSSLSLVCALLLRYCSYTSTFNTVAFVHSANKAANCEASRGGRQYRRSNLANCVCSWLARQRSRLRRRRHLLNAMEKNK